ncbi:MAG: rhomboid family intramembrane serine protease [Thermoanaerobaculales bacterium]|nr:rhomboid family intramembrane serine protease [Thermoanaerobaculales bacterium]
MFIPIGHDQSTVRRLPWVTFSIMGLCLAAFLLTLGPIKSSERLANQRLSEVAEYFFEHPDLELEPEIEDYLFGFIPEYQGQRDAFKEVIKEGARGFGMMDGADEEEESWEEQQQILDDLTLRFHEAVATSPYFRYGLVPANQKAFAYITHQFMHGGFGHIFFNMLFLYLAGPYLEDVWGRPIFAGFYLSAGIFAALVYVLKYPMMEGPLVGASGAIAGLMGAFLIRHSRTKIRLLFFFFLRARVIDASAWIMLPLWLLRELFYGQAIDMAGGQGSGVAHWAHVAGFAFGCVVALSFKHFKVEERFVETALEARSICHENLELEEALEAHRGGDSDRAVEILLAKLKADPTDFDVAAAYWDVARDRGEVAAAVPSMLRVLRDALRHGDLDIVEARWEEVLEMAPEGAIDPVLAARVSETLGDNLSHSLLAATVEAGLAGLGTSAATGVLVRLARVGVRAKSPAAYELIDRALVADDVLPETRQELEEMRSALVVAEPVQELAGDNEAEPISVTKVEHTLKVMEAIPLEWSDGKLTIDAQGTVRPIGVHHLDAVAVAGIAEPGKPAFVLVDLMLDAPWSDRPKLRVVRLRSNAFDPRKLIPGDDGQASFRKLLEDILEISGAVPLPDPDGAIGKPFRRFAGVAEYESEVLGIDTSKLIEPAG